MEKENVLLIDGSAFAFRYAALPDYAEKIDNAIKYMKIDTNATKIVILLEKSKTNFRRQIAVTKEYKGHREAKREGHEELTKYLINIFNYLEYRYGAVKCHGLEVDDVLRILSIRLTEYSNYNPIICGMDSDLLCIEGDHYNLRDKYLQKVTNLGSMEFVTRGVANNKKKLKVTGKYATYAKMMIGAAKENFQGLPKYGEVKVEKILNGCTSEEELAIRTFKEFANTFPYQEAVDKFKEAFRLCYLLEYNNNVDTPMFHSETEGLIELSLNEQKNILQ